MKKKCFTASSIMFFASLLSYSNGMAQTGLKSTPILKSNLTMVGQKLEFSKTDKPEVISSILTIEPQGETGLHSHPNSSHVYVMEGDLTIVVDGKEYHFSQGQAYLESKNILHNAKNTGDKSLKLFVVTFGEEGKSNVVRP